MIIRTLMGLHVPVYGDGKTERDWMYVEDTARVIYEVIKERADWRGEVYNIPGNQRYTY